MGNTIKVKISSEIKEIIPDFLNNRRNDIRSIYNALDAGDYDPIRIIGHSMKGNGESYGFKMISEMGASIEKAAKDADNKTISENTEALSVYLDRVEIEYVEE